LNLDWQEIASLPSESQLIVEEQDNCGDLGGGAKNASTSS